MTKTEMNTHTDAIHAITTIIRGECTKCFALFTGHNCVECDLYNFAIFLPPKKETKQ